jgi:uncharacterized protein (TIGR04540 family)
MLTQYLRNPRTVKLLAEEIKHICDDYWARKITEDMAKDYILYWAEHEGKKLFYGNELNPTVRKMIGSKRKELIDKFLYGTQFSLFI